MADRDTEETGGGARRRARPAAMEQIRSAGACLVHAQKYMIRLLRCFVYPCQCHPPLQVCGTVGDGCRSMYLPVDWGLRTRETTLLGDSATTTRRAGHGRARKEFSEDQIERL